MTTILARPPDECPRSCGLQTRFSPAEARLYNVPRAEATQQRPLAGTGLPFYLKHSLPSSLNLITSQSTPSTFSPRPT